MGGRYLISGSQIGCIVGWLRDNKNSKIYYLLKEIQDKQFLFSSKNIIDKDVQILSEKK